MNDYCDYCVVDEGGHRCPNAEAELDTAAADLDAAQARIAQLEADVVAAVNKNVDHVLRIRTLEAALREIAGGMRGGDILYACECWQIARAALSPETPEVKLP